jgi:hypothetical protein
VSAPGRGRPRRYCRPSHRQRAYEARVAARRHRLGPDEVLISRAGWEALRAALTELGEVGEAVARDLAAGRAPSGDYARAVGSLSGAVAELQRAIEPRARW